jgi:penicillin-binding protein 2
LPSPQWKADHFPADNWEHEWHNYDTYYMAMGQGYVTVTPLQLANYAATIANGGYHMQPYLVDKIISPDNEIVYDFEPQMLNKVEISAEGLAEVQKGARAVIQPGGTAYGVFAGFPINVAGKTGTAQTGLVGDNKNEDFHGTFVAFAPYENPQVAFACIVEYGHQGGTSAGVICREVLAKYFNIETANTAADQ